MKFTKSEKNQTEIYHVVCIQVRVVSIFNFLGLSCFFSIQDYIRNMSDNILCILDTFEYFTYVFGITNTF